MDTTRQERYLVKTFTDMRGAKIGQIQWLLFWAALFVGDGMWAVWVISLFFDDQEL